MLIDRLSLLELIRPFYTEGLIKILKGLPRTGKSSLLRLTLETAVMPCLSPRFGPKIKRRLLYNNRRTDNS